MNNPLIRFQCVPEVQGGREPYGVSLGSDLNDSPATQYCTAATPSATTRESSPDETSKESHENKEKVLHVREKMWDNRLSFGFFK